MAQFYIDWFKGFLMILAGLPIMVLIRWSFSRRKR